MPTTFNDNTFSSTYRDDYKDSDNYHRILFNSGRALQARELTQMQTIIQEEMARFGGNIFKQGASVKSGGIEVNNDYKFVKIAADPGSDITGLIITGTDSTQKARVLEVVAATTTDPATLYVQYLDSKDSTQPSTSPKTFDAGEEITGTDFTGQVQTVDTPANPAMGSGSRVSVGNGSYFVRGHFVSFQAASLILGKYTNNLTKNIGFKITEDIVTSSDTNALFDNQGVTPNLSSPGADRYRIRLTLTTEDQVSSSENFLFYSKVVDGAIVETVNGTDDYNKITEIMATRTKEESGNYFVNNYSIDFEEDSANGDATTVIGRVSPGLAYVNGYRANTPSTTKLTFNRPRTTQTISNQATGISYGSYFLCDELSGLLPIENFGLVNLRDAVDYGGSTIGTARVRSVVKDGNNYRVHIFDIRMNSGKNLRNALSLGTSATVYANPISASSKVSLVEASERAALFPLQRTRPENIFDVSFEVQRAFTETATGTTLDLDAVNDVFASSGDWIIVRNDTGAIVTGTIAATGSSTIQITSLPASGISYSVYAKVQKAATSSSPTLSGSANTRMKTKTLTTVTDTLSMTAFSSGGDKHDSNGVTYLDLGKSDIYDITYIRTDSANGPSIAHQFSLDNGQRATYYDLGRLILASDETAPTGNVFVQYRHFVHNADGDFFSMKSYLNLDYEDIPNFTTETGNVVNLRDMLDFRPVVGENAVGARNFTGTNSTAFELPINGDILTADISYYEPRSDLVLLGQDGRVSTVEGEPAFEPQLPEEPDNTQVLFQVQHNPYGLHDSDLSIRPIRQKRFTMADIGRLEEKIHEVEELATLSLLEVDTASLLVTDSAGLPRTKAGFLVDNFKDLSFSDVGNESLRSAVDPTEEQLRPTTQTNNISLQFDSADTDTSNVTLKGDLIMLDYTHTEYINQSVMSGTENINPFAVITGEGHLTISPASDDWHATHYLPDNVVHKSRTETTTVNEGAQRVGTAVSRGGASFGGARSFRRWRWSFPGAFGALRRFPWVTGLWVGNWWGSWAWNWNGVRTTSTTRSGRSIHRTFTQRIVTGERTVLEETGNRLVSVTFLPKCRARKIFFKAEGLRPNCRYFPFFNGTDVSSWVRGGTEATPAEEFTRVTATGASSFAPKRYRNATQHPDGPVTELLSNGDGVIEGSFFLPETDTLTFPSGDREFKLLDISRDNDAASTSRAVTVYSAKGAINNRQRDVTSTRVTQVLVRNWSETTRVRSRDPLAQTFRIEPKNGLFFTKIDIFFKSKDDTVSVECQIRPVVNGVPSSEEVIASKFLTPSQVSTFDDDAPSDTVENTANVITYGKTTFEFDEPVYLNPNTEYCVVLLAESVEYNVYVAETYALQLGSTESRVAKQPSMGSLFKSQNGTTWEPDQTKDLAFIIHRANFSNTSGSAVVHNREVEPEFAGFTTENGSQEVYVYMPNHGFHYGETATIAGFDSAATYNGVSGSNLNGDQTITGYDGLGFTFSQADSATADGVIASDIRPTTTRQVNMDVVFPSIETMSPEDTSINYEVKYTTGKSIAGTETKYTKDAAYSKEFINRENNFFEAPRLIATPKNETDELGAGVKSVDLKINLTTNDTHVSPVIDAQRLSLTSITNIIDKQTSSGTSGREFPLNTGGQNTPINYVAETSSEAGTHLAKHLTTPVTLENGSVGLKIILSAQRPEKADFDVYYRLATEGENIRDVDFTLATSENTVGADPVNFREYRYRVGNDNGDLNEFTQFQVKIVMTSSNSAQVPVFKDLRVIALSD